MTRFITSTFMALTLFAASPAFANHECSCDDTCAANCKMGKTENCPCQTCDCSKGEGCKHGKCGLKHKSKKAKSSE